MQELLNLQSLHSDVVIMPAYITAMQTEIAKLLANAKQEVKEILTKSPYMNLIHLLNEHFMYAFPFMTLIIVFFVNL